MKNALLTSLFVIATIPASARAEDTATTLIARLAMTDVATQHYAQVFQTRGKLILPDVLYVDFGKNNYREMFVGGGRVWYTGKHLTLTHEDYLGQATGSAAHNALYVLPWTKLDYRFGRKFSGNAVHFFYAPLNRAGKFHQAIERAKLEYSFSKLFKAGAGYGASGPANKPWQHKPMLTATVKCGALGDVEFWLQRLPGNHAQAWLRLVRTFR